MVDRDVRTTQRVVRRANRPRRAPTSAAPPSPAPTSTTALPTPYNAIPAPTPAGTLPPPAQPAYLEPAQSAAAQSALLQFAPPPIAPAPLAPAQNGPAPLAPPQARAVHPAPPRISTTFAGPTPTSTAPASDPVADFWSAAEERRRALGRMRIPERPEGFPTSSTLDEQDAAAATLRAELDQVRRLLDTAPPPLRPVPRRNKKPLLGALVVGGTLGAIATATLVPWSSLDLPGRDGTTTSSSTINGAAVPGSTGPGLSLARPAVGVVPAPAPAPRSAPEGSLPATGPGIDTPGTMMVVQVRASGTLDVVEQAVLGPRGMREISLALPSMSALGGAAANLDPVVRNLRVSVNGTPVNVVAAGDGWTIPAISERARTVQLSYQIARAVVHSKPARTGRALAVSLPLLGQTLREAGLPLVVRAQGTQIGGVTCPSAAPAEMLCGTPTAQGWSATIPSSATSPALLLEVNLKK